MAVRDFSWYNGMRCKPTGDGHYYEISIVQQNGWCDARLIPQNEPWRCDTRPNSNAAVDSIWAASRMSRGQPVFQAYYKAGSVSDICGQWYIGGRPDPQYYGQWYWGNAPGDDMSQNGTVACANQEWVWTSIVRAYYFHNPNNGYDGAPYGAHGTASGQVLLLDDAPGVTEYNGGLYVFAVNKPGQLGTVGGVVSYKIFNRTTQTWGAWYTPLDYLHWIQCTSAPAAMGPASNQLWVMCRGTTGSIMALRWNGNAWTTNWLDLGGVSVSAPAVTEYGSQLMTYHVGTDGNIWKKVCSTSTDCSNPANWIGWTTAGPPGAAQPPGGCTSSPAADWIGYLDLEVFCRGAGTQNGYPKAPIWYSKWNGNVWLPWAAVPGGDVMSGAAATDFFDGAWHFHLHALTETGPVWANQKVYAGNWGGWYQPWLDGYCTSTPGNSNLPPANDWLFVVCRAGGGNFQERHWTTVGWVNWFNLGLPP